MLNFDCRGRASTQITKKTLQKILFLETSQVFGSLNLS